MDKPKDEKIVQPDISNLSKKTYARMFGPDAVAEDTGMIALHRIDTHEAVCAERWKNAVARLSRIEIILLTMVGAVLYALFRNKFGL